MYRPSQAVTLGYADNAEILIDEINSGPHASGIYAGALDIPEFTDRAVVGIQSISRYTEARALSTSWRSSGSKSLNH